MFVLQTVKTEGVLALYKGLVPNWLRLGPFAIIVSFLIIQLIVIIINYVHTSYQFWTLKKWFKTN